VVGGPINKMIREIMNIIMGIYAIVGSLFGFPFWYFAIGWNSMAVIIMSIAKLTEREM